MKNSPTWLDRVRDLAGKYSVQEIVRHLPTLLRIVIQGSGGDVTGAVLGMLAALFGIGTPGMGAREKAAEDRKLLSLAAGQAQLASRVDLIETVQEKLRSEVTTLATQISSLNRELQALAQEIGGLRRRNTYLAWGLVVTFVFACVGFARAFVR